MACGDKYKHLIVTKDGYTLDNQYGGTPFASDYSGWYTRAKELVEMANDAFHKLGDVECQKTGGTSCGTDDVVGGSYPKYNALVPLQNNMIVHFDDLEADWHQISFTQGTQDAIGEAAQVAVEAVCLLESANDAILAYGAKPDVIPDITPKPRESGIPWWVWALAGGGATIVLGSLAYGAVQKVRARRGPPAASGARQQGQVTARRPVGAAA